MSQDNEQIYQQMRGEYLSLMASLEYTMTFLLAEYLKVKNHRDEFHKWFLEAPIPFNYKVSLLKKMLKENPIMEQFGDIWTQLRESYEFRNILAHSFRQWNIILTARGKRIPARRVTFSTLQNKLEKLRSLENLIVNMLANEIEGTLSPISADDFADWPI